MGAEITRYGGSSVHLASLELQAQWSPNNPPLLFNRMNPSSVTGFTVRLIQIFELLIRRCSLTK